VVVLSVDGLRGESSFGPSCAEFCSRQGRDVIWLLVRTKVLDAIIRTGLLVGD
jgi:hypothetical protein